MGLGSRRPLPPRRRAALRPANRAGSACNRQANRRQPAPFRGIPAPTPPSPPRGRGAGSRPQPGSPTSRRGRRYPAILRMASLSFFLPWLVPLIFRSLAAVNRRATSLAGVRVRSSSPIAILLRRLANSLLFARCCITFEIYRTLFTVCDMRTPSFKRWIPGRLSFFFSF